MVERHNGVNGELVTKVIDDLNCLLKMLLA